MCDKDTTGLSNSNVLSLKEIVTPVELLLKYYSNDSIINLVLKTRNEISNILNRKDKRKIVVVGPCSIHDPVAALDYAKRLSELSKSLPNLLIIMRVYFEKPRTTIGWKGLINDPDLNGSNDINKGLEIARKLLIDINNLNLPVGCEILDTITPQYISDLISWGAIGARTTESQVHRQLVSGLSMPIGFKNNTNGDTNSAICAVLSVCHSHTFLGVSDNGKGCVVTTAGNKNTHIILRGGKTPNYDHKSVEDVMKLYDNEQYKHLTKNIMIDCSHGNSFKNYKNQNKVLYSVCNQIKTNDNIIGVMIESNLYEGKQKFNTIDKLKYGVSITDCCVGFEETIEMLTKLNNSVKNT